MCGEKGVPGGGERGEMRAVRTQAAGQRGTRVGKEREEEEEE